MRPRNVLFCTSLICHQLKTSGAKHIVGQGHQHRLFCTMDKVHKVSKAGFKQGHHYDQYRPSYTDEVTSHVLKNLYRGHDSDIQYNVVEIGAGTGKFTRKLKPLLGEEIRYLASDPSEEFLSVIQQQSPDVETKIFYHNFIQVEIKYLASDPSEEFLSVLQQQSPNVETKIFSAFSIPLQDNSVENMVCAQCFHWCANKECLDEMTRVLVPKGRILCIWNNKDWDIDWVRELEDVLTTYYTQETPRAFLKQWYYFVEGYSGLKRVEHSRLSGIPNMKGNKDFVLGRYDSTSVISLLADIEQQEARSKFQSILDKHFPGDPEIYFPNFTEYYCTEKI